jgi:class 3 adenylate cyclase
MNDNERRLKRISGLLKENKSLKEKIFNQKNTILDLQNKNDKLQNNIEKNIKTVHYNMVTVLYIEFYGFSTITNKEGSQTLIDELDKIFFQFGEISKKHNIERIKTIGDAYMCAGGVPIKNSTNSIDVVLAAIEMKKFVDSLQEKYKAENKNFWSYKMGIHSGKVKAQIKGKNKKSYSLFGETVDIASRVKSIAYKGEIATSAMTYELIKEYFTCKYKGVLPVKYKKDYEVYTTTKIKKAYSENREGLITNDIFKTKYKLRQIADLQEIIFDKLDAELPKYLYYHNTKHTIDVLSQVELIGIIEGISDKDLLLLKTAALFHDIGQIHQSAGHEEIGCKYTKEWLPKYGYTDEEIETINGIIMATQLPPKPETLLQKIICDADLDYLGRSDFIPVSDTLFKELNEQKIITDINDWNKMQVKFLSSHSYFTDSASKLRDVNKQEQIKRIESLIK